MKTSIVSNSPEMTEEIANNIGRELKGGEVIELVSELGGGKTTFTHGLVRAIKSQDKVASPTFTISKIYNGEKIDIHHFDFYRLNDPGLIVHELADVLQNKTNVVVIEWPGLVENELPNNRLLVIRTDKPESEVGLYEDLTKLSYVKWQAHLALAETIHDKVSKLLKDFNKSWHELTGLVVYKGPGSFTGLRIGIAFANTLVYSLNIPIIGSQTEDWIDLGIKKLLDNKNEKIITPEYGAEAHITMPKK